MERELLRIQFVGRRYPELQGLRIVLVGGVFTLVFGAYVVAPPAEGGAAIWIALGAAFAVIASSMRSVERWYEGQFGRVVPLRDGQSSWKGAASGIGCLLTSMVLRIPPAAMAMPMVAWLHLWVAIRDWPYRRYHLFGSITATVSTLLLLTPAAHAAPDLAVAAGFLLVGVVTIPIGFLDHQLLVSVMQAGRPDHATVLSEARDQRD